MGEKGMTRRCCVCGCEFEPKRKDSVTCSNKDCRQAHYREGVALWKEKHYDRVLESNRNWIKKNRAKKKAEKELRLSRQNFTAEGYAERQKQRTLELAGRVQI